MKMGQNIHKFGKSLLILIYFVIIMSKGIYRGSLGGYKNIVVKLEDDVKEDKCRIILMNIKVRFR